MSDYEDEYLEDLLFNAVTESRREKTSAEKLVQEIEDEHHNAESIHIQREKEKKFLKEKLKETKKKLASIKNPKGAKSPQRRKILTDQTSKQREKLRKEISRLKVEIDDLAIECSEPIEAEKWERIEDINKLPTVEERREKISEMPWIKDEYLEKVNLEK